MLLETVFLAFSNLQTASKYSKRSTDYLLTVGVPSWAPVVTGASGLQEPLANNYRDVGDSRHYKERDRSSKCETSLSMFYETVKTDVVFGAQVPALSSEAQGCHFTQRSVRAQGAG